MKTSNFNMRVTMQRGGNVSSEDTALFSGSCSFATLDKATETLVDNHLHADRTNDMIF